MEIVRPESNQPIPEHAKKVFSGVMFDVYQWEQELFDGTTTTFEKVKRPDTVVVFPVLPSGNIILTEQEQPGKKSFIGATGGRIDEGEGVLEAAKRELLEESGYEAEKYILWDAQHPVGKIDWVVYTFVAKGIKKVADMNLDGGEKIKLKEVTLSEFIEIATMDSGEGFFSEKEVIFEILRAKNDPKKMEELKKKFDPKL